MCSREPWMPMTSPRRATRLPGAFDVVAGDPYKAVIALGNNRLKVKSLRTDPQIKADYVLDTFHNVVEITLAVGQKCHRLRYPHFGGTGGGNGHTGARRTFRAADRGG